MRFMRDLLCWIFFTLAIAVVILFLPLLALRRLRMFGRRIRQTAEGVAAHAHQSLDKSEQLMGLLGQLATATVDDLREFIAECGDEVNIAATLKLADDFDLQDLLSGKTKEIPLSLNLKIKVKE